MHIYREVDKICMILYAKVTIGYYMMVVKTNSILDKDPSR